VSLPEASPPADPAVAAAELAAADDLTAHPGRERRIRRASLAATGALLLLLLSAQPLAGFLGHQLVRDDHPVAADAAVVLGGDVHKRAPHALRLYQHGVVPVILAVGGTSDQGPLAEAQKTAKIMRAGGVPESALIIVGHDEPSTVDEARAIARVAAQQHWTTLIVVTSPYHTWRAGKLVEAAVDDRAEGDAVDGNVKIMLSPSPDDPFDPDHWWQDPRQRRQVRNEYGKALLWWLGIQASDLPSQD